MSVSTKYAEFAGAFANATSDRVIRPADGNYTLTLRGGTIEDGEFRWKNPTEGKLPAISIQALWTLDDNPMADGPLNFPGRRWIIPTQGTDTLPENQKKRADIALSQFKSFVEGLVGNDPGPEVVDVLEGLFSHAATISDTEDAMRFNVSMRYDKKQADRFDREIVSGTV